MMVKTTAKGEKVIMDPSVTISRVYLYFYLMINIGSLVGSIGMVYAEKYVGFWLSYLLPTLMLCKSSLSELSMVTSVAYNIQVYAPWSFSLAKADID